MRHTIWSLAAATLALSYAVAACTDPAGPGTGLVLSDTLPGDTTPPGGSPLGDRVRLRGRPFGVAISTAGVAYVTQLDFDQLARADLPSHTLQPVVTAGAIPTDVAFNSTGTHAFVANQYGQTISVIDTRSNTQIATFSVTGDPFKVIVAPGDSIVYVTTNADYLYGIRVSTGAVVAELALPATSMGFAVRDTLLFISTRAGGTIVEFNLLTRTVARTLAVGGVPQDLVLSPDGTELYIANETGYVQFWDLGTGTQIGSDLLLPGGGGFGMAERPSDGRLFVTTGYYGRSVHVVNPVSRSIEATFDVGGVPRRVAFAVTGRTGMVTNEGGWVDVLK